MGIATTTLEMRSPEEHRERLHEIVKDASSVMVLSRVPGHRDAIDGQVMALVRTADDTTMYAAARLTDEHADELDRAAQVTVVVPGASLALFTAEARITRDRQLLDELRPDLGSELRGSRGERFAGHIDPSLARPLAIVVLLPLEGSYWDAGDRHSYMYRLLPRHEVRDHESDGIPVEL